MRRGKDLGVENEYWREKTAKLCRMCWIEKGNIKHIKEFKEVEGETKTREELERPKVEDM